MPPMPRARRCSTSPRRTGTRSCSPSSMCRARCCRRYATARQTSVTSMPASSAAPSPSVASPATSRPRLSARPASRRAWRSPPMAPVGFIVLNTGAELKLSRNRLLSTVAYRLEGKPTFALEGSIFIAGAARAVAARRAAPDPDCRRNRTAGQIHRGQSGRVSGTSVHRTGCAVLGPAGARRVFGLTRDTGIAQIARAALEAMGYQTRDLLQAMAQDAIVPTELRVDGGMVINDWVTQNLADMLQLPVVRPQTIETTALGAAFLAGFAGRRLQLARGHLAAVAGRAPLHAADVAGTCRHAVCRLEKCRAARALGLLTHAEAILPPRLVHHHRHRVRQIQAPVRRPHGDAQPFVGWQPGRHLRRQATGLAPEQKLSPGRNCASW